MLFPQHLFYTKDHEWISFDHEYAFIGITEFAQKELGDIVYLDIPSLNKSIEKEAVFGTVEAVKTVSDLFMPMSGKIVAVNSNLEKNPDMVNKDPYGSWIIKILWDANDRRADLLTDVQYKNLVT